LNYEEEVVLEHTKVMLKGQWMFGTI